MPDFSFRNSSVSTSAIFVSGKFPLCAGALGAGVAVGFGWAKTEEALIAAKKAIAAIAREIFISVL